MKHTQGKVQVSSSTMLVNEDRMLIANTFSMQGLGDIQPDILESQANANRIAAIWNAANGMPTEEAVKYIEHGREMVHHLSQALMIIKHANKTEYTGVEIGLIEILAKLEGK